MPPKQELTDKEQKQQQAHLDNHANQLNEKHPLFRPKHEPPGYIGNEAAMKLRAKQLNPNNSLHQAPKNLNKK